MHCVALLTHSHQQLGACLPGMQAGPRKIVPSAEEVGAMVNRKALIVPVYLADDAPRTFPTTSPRLSGRRQKVHSPGCQGLCRCLSCAASLWG